MSDIKTHYRNCNICEAMCGLEISYQDKQILSIKGDQLDPFSQGYNCPKALALEDFYTDKDRLKTPIKRSDSGWQAISWDDAFSEITDKFKSIQQQHGKNALAVYLGNPNAHSLGNALVLKPFMKSLGTVNRFSSASADQLPHHVASNFMFGAGMLIPVPDIDGIVLQLSILIQQVSDLRLAGEVVVAGSTDTAEQASKPSAADNTLKGLGRRLIEDLSALVRIRNVETTQAPNLAPDQRFLVYESVRSPLNAAQLALLRGLPAVYRSSLDRALGALTRGFDETSTEVVVFRSVIQELAVVELTNEYPDLSKTLGLLREIIHRRSGSE